MSSRIITLPDGEKALNLNKLSYQRYITEILPQLSLSPPQKALSGLIRHGYQDVTRNSVYKWFGNPCRYKRAGSLSCSEYTLMMTQLCGFKTGLALGWKTFADEDPYLFKHPLMFTTTLPVIGPRLRQKFPAYDYTKLPTDHKPIPLNLIKNTQALTLIQDLNL